MSDEQIAVETTGAVESGTPAPSAPESFDQTLDRVASEVIGREPNRGPDGRFQPKVAAPGAPEAVEVPGGPQAAPAPEPALPAIEVPLSLPEDARGLFTSLPRAAQEAWAKREGEMHKQITSNGERLKSLSAFEELSKTLEPRLKQLNAPAAEYFRRLANADELISTKGVSGLEQVAREVFGIDLRAALLQHPGAQPDPNSALAQQVTQLQSELKALRDAQEQVKVNAAEMQIEAVKKDMPHFDAVEPTMAALYKPGEDLKSLYRRAVRAHDETWEKVQAEEKAAADKKAADEAKAKADKDRALQPLAKRPGSAPTAPLKGKTIWDTMDRVSSEIKARV